MDLLYTQALVFFAVFFMPLAPLLGIITTLLVFVVKWGSLMVFLEPFSSKAVYRMSSNDNFSYSLLLVFFIITVGFTGYAILWLTPSKTCSPFRGENSAWSILANRASLWPEDLQNIIAFILSSAFVVPFIAGLL